MSLSVRFFGDEGIVTAVDDVSFASVAWRNVVPARRVRVRQDGHDAFADAAPAGNG